MLSHFCNILQSYPRELFGLYDEKVFKRTGKFRNGAVDWSVKIELCSEISICGGCGLFFGHSGKRVKGLIFCGRKDEAREPSAKFNRARKKDGLLHRTTVLTGEDSQEQQEAVINRLTDDEHSENQLVYIFTVDVFNEGWEFPGGKIEPEETPQEALAREIREELDTEIAVGEFIDTIEYDYPKFHLSMDCFWCTIVRGDLTLKEAEDEKWLGVEELDSVEWLPVDVTLIPFFYDGKYHYLKIMGFGEV